jgi:hypothetical protein
MNIYILLFFIIIGYIIYQYNHILFYIALLMLIIFIKNNPILFRILLNI